MNQKISLTLFISIGFNILFVFLTALFLTKKGGYSYLTSKISRIFGQTNDVTYSPHYHHKKSQYEILAPTESAIIFLGDSLTEQGEWTELLKCPIKNRGISGDTTERILNRLDTIVKLKPKQIFLMIGINDFINEGKSINDILEGYTEILSQLQNKTPNTQVFVQSVLPVNNKYNRYWYNNNDLVKLNKRLQKIAKQFNYQYVDIFSKLLDADNQLDTKYTSDGLHLNGQAYLVWKQVLEKYIVEK